jgi:hypothetical protein
MAAIHDLIAQVAAPRPRERLAAEGLWRVRGGKVGRLRRVRP